MILGAGPDGEYASRLKMHLRLRQTCFPVKGEASFGQRRIRGVVDVDQNQVMLPFRRPGELVVNVPLQGDFRHRYSGSAQEHSLPKAKEPQDGRLAGEDLDVRGKI